ncbi:S8 family serine peptidase [Neobacillus ginsengisoli]|uniref:Subtilisin family serine protease n=1 Tax=Neobacillus ginsengisoli TaxID=904295 RepID=A0ABT9XSZ1_9BACI|nr:S8 family serine peptidase [Neobacillus ginsengisoli]MDQ0198682.1 subtilisin family serine protease [Neobacillus ginsengisoli]
MNFENNVKIPQSDFGGRPLTESNLGGSVGKKGLSAPGDNITSLSPNGKPLTFGGTSVAAPFVSGTIALLYSLFPTATATEMRFAVTQSYFPRRTTVVPPLLNAWSAYQYLVKKRS